MLRTDKPIYKVILILNLLFIVAGIVACVIGIASPYADAYRIISRAVSIAVLAFGGFYILSGYTKDAAKYYKLFGALYAVKLILKLLSGIVHAGTPLGIMLGVFSLVFVLVLLLSENLGKQKSLILCGLLVIVGVVVFVISALDAKYQTASAVIEGIVNIDLACLYGIMTYAKYLDKAERGTK